MAIHAPITGAPIRAPFIPIPPAVISRALSRFDREQLSGFIAVAIDLLDFADGDRDLELDGDELDGDIRSEDSFEYHGGYGPGCPIADADHEDDGRETENGL